MRPLPRSMEMLDAEMVEVLRGKTPAERLAISNGMWRFARTMIEAIIRAEKPEWSEDAIRREIARRMSHGAA